MWSFDEILDLHNLSVMTDELLNLEFCLSLCKVSNVGHWPSPAVKCWGLSYMEKMCIEVGMIYLSVY